MSKQRPLKMTWNNIINADCKPYLPIIGNSIPHKQIATFDGADSLVFTQLTGTATGAYDKIKAYHGKACYKVTLADTSSASIQLDFNTPIDLTSLGRKQNNFALINQTGKYGNTQDQLFLVLNFMFSQASDPSTISIVIYNGVKTATLIYNTFLNSTQNNRWIKAQYALNSTAFLYQNGFTDSDFLNVTGILISVANTTSQIFYFQDLYAALPKTNSENYSTTNPTITGAYYPATDESTSMFVSQLFGLDTNAGTLKMIGSTSGPVKTIEQAIANALVLARPNIIILDSATYKPVALDGSYVGIQQSLTNDITILADYLETPVISAKPGLFDINRVGTRTDYRTAFYENLTGSGTIRTVGAGGAFATIGAANTAATAGDCIRILDNATYNETLTCNKNIVIESVSGQTPIWKYTSGDTVLNTNGYVVHVRGIIFQGRNSVSDRTIIIGDANATIRDCSLSNAGQATGAAAGITYTGTTASNVIYIDSCAFSNNAENYTALTCGSGTAGKIRLINNIGHMGTTSNNMFVQSGKANTNPLNIISVGNQSLSSYAGKVSNAYFYYCYDTTHSTGATNFYSLLNDTNEAINGHDKGAGLLGDRSLISNVYLYYNYFHDATICTAQALFQMTSPLPFDTLLCSFTMCNNYFDNIGWTGNSPSLGIIFMFIPYGVTNYIQSNIFSNCSCAGCLETTIGAINAATKNVFYNCNTGYKGGGVNLMNNIFVDCVKSIDVTTNSSFTVQNNIAWNSPVNDPTHKITYVNFVTDADPKFIDPKNGNFGWPYDSPIETLPEGLVPGIGFAFDTLIINPSGAKLNFEFIDIEGFYNTTMLSANTSTVTATYCNINNSLVGAYNYNGQVDIQNCFMTGNGIAIRENNINIISASIVNQNIIDTNGTGVMLLSGCTCKHNTIINNNYGIANIFSGFYNQSNYMSQYITLENNIVARNAAWDYVGTSQSDYSIMPNRYFDSLPITNTAHVNTMGAHDQTGQPEIDAPIFFNQNLINIFTYFPDTIFAGFMSNSPAWQTASDTYLNGQGQTVNLNIGARSIPAITTTLDFSEYDFNYSGVISSAEAFYALENPNTVEYSLKPINNESMRFITGEYENSPTAYTPELLLKWAAAGQDARILDTGRAAFEGAFQSVWVTGLSFDGGTTFIYYKIDKDTAMSMSQQTFLYNDTNTQPYGNYQLHLIQMPISFIVTDYLTNQLGE